MRLPASIIRGILSLPEDMPVSFTIHTDGYEKWRIEVVKNFREDNMGELVDLSVLLDDADEN